MKGRLAAGSVVAVLVAGPARAQDRFAPPAPQNEYGMENNVPVPMRDGVTLAADLYLPKSAAGRFPVILLRTPYNKDSYRGSTGPAEFFAARGFAVVSQDVRGKWSSDGEYQVQSHDRDDGYDTMEWIARQPWSNGKVGTYGCSYLGEVQILLAGARHPNHAAAVPQAAAGGLGSAGGYWSGFGAYENGVFSLSSAFGWFLGAGAKDKNPAPPDRFEFATVLRSRPSIEMVKRVGGPRSDFEDFLRHRPGDRYWATQGYATDSTRFDVPAIHVNSWLDYGAEQTLALFNLFKRNAVSPKARDNQYVIISPTSHCASERATEHTVVGERDMGDARLGYWSIYLAWFDYWLKGIGDGVEAMPKVQYYVTGLNAWRSSNVWPVPEMKPVSYYLASGKAANGGSGDGRLSLAAGTRAGKDTVSVDPANPFPSRGGTICCTGNPADQPGVFDQADLEQRTDLLVYTTPPLGAPVTVAGPVRAKLFVSTETRDADIAAKLIDVTPDGKSWNVVDGIARLRLRNGADKPELVEPGRVYEIEVNLKSIAHQFKAGHRIRLHLAGSNFPQWELNSHTGGNIYDETEYLPTRTTIHFGPARPSALLLPVVPK
ncbi:MAG: CocE/NonD family hydrolase [Gemmatimonadetes bacterium]|nr:CocE/NonD family hydrolase [Gemmatimonadota bacterium]